MTARRRLMLVAAAAAGAFAVAVAVLPHSPAGMRALVAGAGPLAVLALVLVWTVATPALVSGTLLAAAGGLLFGPLLGSVVSVVGAGVGAAVAFVLARRLGGDGLRSIGARASRFCAAIEQRGFRSVLTLRAAPAVPATLVNYAAGLTRIRLRDFVAGSVLGGAPRTVAYSLLGSGAADPTPAGVAAPAVILIVMALVGLVAAGSAFGRPRSYAS